MKIDDFEIGGRQSPTATSDRKFFTLQQANAALPLVQRITEDIIAQYSKVMQLHEEIQSQVETLPEKKLLEMESDKQTAGGKLNDWAAELSEIGCELKDWEAGLVDFPARRDGKRICLCWKLGEDTIGYWHDLNDGFAGRQPITEADQF